MKINCQVCKEPSSFYHRHPEADLYKCHHCGHVFSVDVKTGSIYAEKYFSETHNNWFKNPDTNTYQTIYNFIRETKRGESALIDLGCGNGMFLDYARDKDKDLRLIGVDLSDNRARNNIRFIQCDVKELKTDERYEFISLLAFIEHVVDLDQLASTLNSISRQNTYVIILTINENSILYRTALLLKMLNINKPFDRLYSAHHVQHFSDNSLKEYMKRAGYEHVKTVHHNIHMKAMDIEASNQLMKNILKCGVYATFLLGIILKRTYLQTAFFRKAK
jgi:2-polyprenyl-3-methyl-5-hydroxy-6-metoxy-1,4-benzoquinol methylase